MVENESCACIAQEKDYEKHRQYLAQMARTTKPYQPSPRKLQVVCCCDKCTNKIGPVHCLVLYFALIDIICSAVSTQWMRLRTAVTLGGACRGGGSRELLQWAVGFEQKERHRLFLFLFVPKSEVALAAIIPGNSACVCPFQLCPRTQGGEGKECDTLQASGLVNVTNGATDVRRNYDREDSIFGVPTHDTARENRRLICYSHNSQKTHYSEPKC